jgi:site-specific DNA-methyltransferase (adenine-specific)
LGRYKIVYADPPWRYHDKASAGQRGACYKYAVLGTDGICALPVADLAADDCVLFLWATFPLLPDAFRVLKAWGFGYKTASFVWVKTNKNTDTDFFGMGNWTRANAEIVLLGAKGKPKRLSASVRQIVHHPIMRHSEKPNEVRERIVTLMGNLPRIELFARTKVSGWDCWGNEVESDINLLGDKIVEKSF